MSEKNQHFYMPGASDLTSQIRSGLRGVRVSQYVPNYTQFSAKVPSILCQNIKIKLALSVDKKRA